MSRDRCRLICKFEAPDAETVRKSFRKAGLLFARIWAVNIIEPDVTGEQVSTGKNLIPIALKLMDDDRLCRKNG
jgi:hypothetical protein